MRVLQAARNSLFKIKLQKCANFASLAESKPQPSPNVLYSGIFINNEWHKSSSGATFPTINPANGKVITEVQQGGKDDIDRAVAAANEAFRLGSTWRTLDASERGRLLYKLADLIERDAAYIAIVENSNKKKYKPFDLCRPVSSQLSKNDAKETIKNVSDRDIEQEIDTRQLNKNESHITPSTSKKQIDATPTQRRKRLEPDLKALTSSEVSEKYNKLLDIRLEIANFSKKHLQQQIQNQQKKHEKEIALINLKILVEEEKLKRIRRDDY